MENVSQNTKPNNFDLVTLDKNLPDTLDAWAEFYFSFEVTTSELSQKEQKRDMNLFLSFMAKEIGNLERTNWTPRLTQSFVEYMRHKTDVKGKRRWGDKYINRIMATIKTFAKWVHKYKPFPLDNPTIKIRSLPTGLVLDIERAITGQERNRILDAADSLLISGGISKDRKRYKTGARPKRKNYRPYRNRAIIYTLTETGMRRKAVTNIDIHNINFDRKTISVVEKGGFTHSPKISQEGLNAIKAYIDRERLIDNERWNSPTLFLSNSPNKKGNGRLTPQVINSIWNDVCKKAGIEGRTPHSTRHGMGNYLIEKTGNIAVAQRQLGHRNPAHTMIYCQAKEEVIEKALDER